MKDWTGTAQFITSTNNRRTDAEVYDYYATEPKAVEILLENEKFSPVIWENAVGGGHIADVLKQNGYTVKCSDVIDRGYPNTHTLDFLKYNPDKKLDLDIITNPPYSYAKEFVEKSLQCLSKRHKVAMFLKLTFLEGKARRELFNKYPPKTVYVFSSRVCCGKNGSFNQVNNAVAYAWFVWEVGFKGDPIIKWIN